MDVLIIVAQIIGALAGISFIVWLLTKLESFADPAKISSSQEHLTSLVTATKVA